VLGIDRSTMVSLVDQLEAAGLACREADPSDGRRALVRLQPEGHELAERALAARARLLDHVVADLDPAALDPLLDAILHVTTVDALAASRTCRLCDAHACGHHEGRCPVTRGADAAEAAARI
jgi:DNA-binding MarR family transcriptional regulator